MKRSNARNHGRKKKIDSRFVVIIAVSFGIIGLVLFQGSRAATLAAVSEAESGTLTGAAAQTTDTNASGGMAVKFGSASTTTNTCPSPKPTVPVTGYTVSACEDFNGTNLGSFSAYDGGGGNTVVGVGRVPGQCTVSNGYLHLVQASDGSTCGGWMKGFSQQYGYWEVKMRVYSTGTTGSEPHPVLILFPTTGPWTSELDYFETNIGSPAGGFLHCANSAGDPSITNQNCYILPDNSVDYLQWHVYGIKWTPNCMTGYIDAEEWWNTCSTSSFQPIGASNQTIQLDNLSGSTPVRPGEMDIDWAHMYK